MIKNKLLPWLANSRFFRFSKKTVAKIIFIGVDIVWSAKAKYNPEIPVVKDLIKEIKKETQMLLEDWEAFQIYMAVKQTAKIKGEIAEVGVFRGGSAKLICEAKENKELHLFDTFEGLPDLNQVDSPKKFHKNQFSSSFDEVKDYLKSYQDVYFYKGLFPSTAGPITDKRFSFVHLDVDLYESTLECIKFFYSRMEKGGILISHDYRYAPGVKKAFDEFFNDKPEPVIETEILGTQCLVVKT